MVANQVDGARIHAGVSFSRLAELSGIAPAALADLLEGRSDFTLVELADIAGVLGVPVTTLVPASVPDAEPGAR